jgi:hypothetical protein
MIPTPHINAALARIGLIAALRRIIAKPEVHTCQIHKEMVEFYSIFLA